jgi:hypothetical protein
MMRATVAAAVEAAATARVELLAAAAAAAAAAAGVKDRLAVGRLALRTLPLMLLAT